MTLRGQPSILICGAGIAGPGARALAGARGVLADAARARSALREGGYIIDFWANLVPQGSLLPQVLRAGYPARELGLVDQLGRRAASFELDLLELPPGGEPAARSGAAQIAELGGGCRRTSSGEPRITSAREKSRGH